MQHGIFLLDTLFLNIFRNRTFISKLTHRIGKISISPKFTSPQLLLYLRIPLKNFLRRDTFYHHYYLCYTIRWNRLNQKMNMVFIRSYLDKLYFVPLTNFYTHIPQF